MKSLSDFKIPRLSIYEGEYVAFAKSDEGKYFWSRENFKNFAGESHQPSSACPLCGGAAIEEGDRWVCAQQSFYDDGRLVDDELDCDWTAPAPARAILTIVLDRPVNADVKIPKGFLVSATAQKEAVVFATDRELRVPAWTLKALVSATCTEPGTKGNVGRDATAYIVKPLNVAIGCSAILSVTRNGLDTPLFY